jgi:hypothetical protein
MRTATAWRLCVLAGLVAFVVSWGFGQIAGLAPCGPTPGGLGSIIGFELARTPAEIAAMFGAEPCRSRLAAAQIDGLWLDALAFIPAYTAFLVLAAAAACRGWLRKAVVAMLLVAAIGDEIEGLVMAGIMRALPGTVAQLGQLYWAVHIKFALLALATALIGLAVLRGGSLLAALLGVVVWVGGMAAIYGFGHLPAPIMMTAFSYAWFALLATAIAASFAPGLFAGRGSAR